MLAPPAASFVTMYCGSLHVAAPGSFSSTFSSLRQVVFRFNFRLQLTFTELEHLFRQILDFNQGGHIQAVCVHFEQIILIARKTCCRWEFAGCIIFWPCFFRGWVFCRFGCLLEGFGCWCGWAFSSSGATNISAKKCSHSIPQICGVSPQGIYTFVLSSNSIGTSTPACYTLVLVDMNSFLWKKSHWKVPTPPSRSATTASIFYLAPQQLQEINGTLHNGNQ